MFEIEKDMYFFDDKKILDAEYVTLTPPTPLTLFHMVTPSP
jgi:hypothetical protein